MTWGDSLKTDRKATRTEIALSDRNFYERILYNAKLTPQEQEICNMRYLKGMSFTQIASELGYSVDGIYRKHGKILDKVAHSFS